MPTCSASCAGRLGVLDDDEPAGELDLLVRVLDALPAPIGATSAPATSPRRRSASRPIQFVDVFPNTPDRKVDLFPEALDGSAPAGLYRYQPDPATERYPLALISPASDRTISSTLGELPRPDVKLHDASRRCARRAGWPTGDLVRIFNDLGEVHCPLTVSPSIRRAR